MLLFHTQASFNADTFKGSFSRNEYYLSGLYFLELDESFGGLPMKCRNCKTYLSLEMIDLGTAPPSNAYLSKTQLNAPELYYPLKVLVCESCWLVQTQDFSCAQDLFTDNYAYFSSYSSSWLAHAKSYVEEMISRLNLNRDSIVMEVAANDGYLLKNFQAHGIPCFGIEPTASTAASAKAQGIDIIEEFFGKSLASSIAKTRGKVDLALGNNVLAHVPDINDFVAGFRDVIKPEGVITFEFPHLLNLLKFAQFDTIYHEHYSYLSLISVKSILNSHGLTIFDVEHLETHGGSYRVYAQLSTSGRHTISPAVAQILQKEHDYGIDDASTYANFAKRTHETKNRFVAELLKAKCEKKRIVAYGAAAKGNTLLNYAGIKADTIDYVVDKNPHKQGLFMPGSRIPIVSKIGSPKPDIILILPWNLFDEIKNQLSNELDSTTAFWTYFNFFSTLSASRAHSNQICLKQQDKPNTDIVGSKQQSEDHNTT